MSTEQQFFEEFDILFEPLLLAGESPTDLFLLLSKFGWTKEYTDEEYSKVKGFINFAEDINELKKLIDAPKFDIAKAASIAGKVFTDIINFSNRKSTTLDIYPFNNPGFWTTIGEQLFNYLLYTYLEKRLPVLLGTFKLFGIAEKNIKNVEGDNYFEYKINFNAITNFKDNIKSYYSWNTQTSDEKFKYELFLDNLNDFFNYLGLNSILKIDSNSIPLVLFNLFSYYYEDDTTSDILSFNVNFIPDSLDNPQKILVQPQSSFAIDQKLAYNGLTFDIGGDFSSTGLQFSVSPDLVEMSSQKLNGNGKLSLSMRGDGPYYIFGNTDTSSLTLGNFILSSDIQLNTLNKIDYDIKLELQKFELVIKKESVDSFLNAILPDDPITAIFDLTFGYSSKRGFYFEGGAGLEYSVSINKALGPFFVNSIDLGLFLNEKGVSILTGITGNATLGPIYLSAKKLGLKTIVEFNKPGLLGNTNLDFGFKPPESLGLAINSSMVKGGGYLAVNNGNYAGAFEVTVQDKIAVQVIAIIITKLPDGTETFSFKMLGCAQFPPIQLGFGFSLTGLGLAIAIQCCMSEESLRSAIYGGSIRSLLFPENVVENAPKIINDLNKFFPPHNDYYIIGAMVQLGWGPGKPLIYADVGIFIEIGKGLRIALAGIAHADLPNEETAILQLRIQVLGILDFNGKSLSIDSSLFGSRIMDWTLDGDVAVRANWGDNPRFIMSAGGFFPGYIPPSDFPVMKRMSLIIGSGNPYIGLFSYFAIAENSCQLGAALVFSWKEEFSISLLITDISFSIEVKGGASFDALFRFNPFYFDIRLQACFSVLVDGDDVASIDLRLEIQGPNPYHITGYGRISILGIGVDVSIDSTFGDSRPEIEVARINAIEVLKNELNEIRNWSFAPISDDPEGVLWLPDNPVEQNNTLETPVNPAGLKVSFNQKSVPLNVAIQKVGACKLADENINCFDIQLTYKMVDNNSINNASINDKFSPGQFMSLSDEQEISAPPYRSWKSGTLFESRGDYDFDKSNTNKCLISYDSSFIDAYIPPSTGTTTPIGRRAIPVDYDYMKNKAILIGRKNYTSNSLLLKKTAKTLIEIEDF